MRVPAFASLRLSVGCFAVGAITCSGQTPPAVQDNGSAGPAVVIGEQHLSAELLAGLRSRAPADASRNVHAVDEFIANSVLAYALRRWDTSAAANLERVALANGLTSHIWDKAKAEGEITSEELQDWTNKNWVTKARPPAARVVHAVVMIDAVEEQGAQASALAVARQLRAAVVDAADDKDFEHRARAVAKGPFDIRVESLQPVTLDGRIVRLDAPPGQIHFGTYEAAFARAANALEQPGETSEILRTGYGYHVLRLIERLPASELDLEERREQALPDVLRQRARSALEQVLAAQRSATSIERERSGEEATGRVRVQP